MYFYKIQIILETAEANAQREVTSRWESDMNSDPACQIQGSDLKTSSVAKAAVGRERNTQAI